MYIKCITKSHNQNITPPVVSDSNNKNKISLQSLPECLKPTTLYDHHKIVPIPSDSIEKMYQEVGPKEGTTHHQAIASKFGFSYRTLLGEIMYAYMTC